MKKIGFLIALLFSIHIAKGQSLEYAWHGAGSKLDYQLICKQAGQIYISSRIFISNLQTIDLDPTSGTDIYSANGNHAWAITALDINGNYLWTSEIVTDGSAGIFSLIPNPYEPGVIASGYADTAGLDFDPSPLRAGAYGDYATLCYVAFYDPSGAYLGHFEYPYAVNVSTGPGFTINKIASIGTDYLLMTGVVFGKTDLDFSIGVDTVDGGANGLQYMVAMNLRTGQYAWSKPIVGGNQTDFSIRSMDDDADQLSILAEVIGDSIYLDPSDLNHLVDLRDNGYTSLVLYQIDTLGRYVKGGAIEAVHSTIYPYGLSVDELGNTYLLAATYDVDSINFGINGNPDWHVIDFEHSSELITKFDQNYARQWTRSFHSNWDGSGGVHFFGIDASDGFVQLTGGLVYALVFVSNNTSQQIAIPDSDEYVRVLVCLHENGGLAAANIDDLIHPELPIQLSQALGIVSGSDGSSYSIGYYRGEVDFDPLAGFASSLAFDTTSTIGGSFIIKYELNGFVAIHSPAATHPITVYPNPTSGKVNLVSDAEILSSEVLDMAGKTMTRESYVRNSMAEINLMDLPNGIYMVRIQDENGMKILRVIKQ